MCLWHKIMNPQDKTPAWIVWISFIAGLAILLTICLLAWGDIQANKLHILKIQTELYEK